MPHEFIIPSHSTRRTLRLVADISVPLPGGITDWPAYIQDPFFEKIEEREKEFGVAYQIIHSESNINEFTSIPYALVICEAVKNNTVQ